MYKLSRAHQTVHTKLCTQMKDTGQKDQSKKGQKDKGTNGQKDK